MDNSIRNLNMQPRIVCFTVDGTGTAAVSGPDKDLVTLTDNGTGDYTLTFATALHRIPYVFAPLSLTDNIIFYHQAVQTSLTVVRILSKSVETTPAATDCDFQVMMLIHQSPTDHLIER